MRKLVFEIFLWLHSLFYYQILRPISGSYHFGSCQKCPFLAINPRALFRINVFVAGNNRWKVNVKVGGSIPCLWCCIIFSASSITSIGLMMWLEGRITCLLLCLGVWCLIVFIFDSMGDTGNRLIKRLVY